MADGQIPIQTPEETSQLLDAEAVDFGGGVIRLRERMEIGGVLPAQVAIPTDANPSELAYGLPVREVGSAGATLSRDSATALAAGASADLDAAPVANLATGYLLGVDLGSSAACKWEIQRVVGGVAVTQTVFYTSGLAGQVPGVAWRPPGRHFVPPINGNGTDGFRVRVTNLDGRNAADAHTAFYGDEG